MYSLQKLLPPSKTNLKPGIFSHHTYLPKSIDTSFTRNNTTQDTTLNKMTLSADINLCQPQQQMTMIHQQTNNKKTPSKYKSETQIRKSDQQHPKGQNLLEQFHQYRNNPKTLHNLLEQGKQKTSTNEKRSICKKNAPSQSGGKKLNFEQVPPMDNAFLNSTNQMANMIIENILNKDEYYEKVKSENQELKDEMNEMKKVGKQKDIQINDLQQQLTLERQRYQGELMKIQNKLTIVKELQNNVQSEKQKNDQLAKKCEQFNQKYETLHAKHETVAAKCESLMNQNNNIKQFLVDISNQSIDFLNYFQENILSNELFQYFSQMLRQSIEIILEIIDQASQITKQTFKLPSQIDFETFFSALEQYKIQGSPTSSSELSFRQKPSAQNSLPLSQVHVKQSSAQSRNISLQEQFNTFLQDEQQLDMGSPYFTHALPLQMEDKKPLKLQEKFQQQIQEADRSEDMPRQMNNAQMLILSQNRFQTEFSDTNRTDIVSEAEKPKVQQQQLQQNFHSFNNQQEHISVIPQTHVQSEQDVYDSLFKEMNNQGMNNRGKKSSSIHTMKYLDQQIDREETKKRSSKENQVELAIAKFDYKAKKVVYNIK